MKHSPADIRKFIVESFSDAELGELCFDYFPEVYNDFTDTMPKGQKVLLLVTYCQRREKLTDLVAAVERERPGQLPADLIVTQEWLSPAEPERNTRQVFVSHAHEDRPLAMRLADALQANGWGVWIAPDSIRPGEKWVEAIKRGLMESGAFLLVQTASAARSRWVKRETEAAIDMARAGDLRFIPMRAEATDVPHEWAAYQYIDFVEGSEAGIGSLLEELDRGVAEGDAPGEVTRDHLTYRARWRRTRQEATARLRDGRATITRIGWASGLYAGLGAIVTAAGTIRDNIREDEALAEVSIGAVLALAAIFFAASVFFAGIWGAAVASTKLVLDDKPWPVRVAGMGLMGAILGSIAFSIMVQGLFYSWSTGLLVAACMAWLPLPGGRKTWVTEWLAPGTAAVMVAAAGWALLQLFDEVPADNVFGVLASALFAALFLRRVASPRGGDARAEESAGAGL